MILDRMHSSFYTSTSSPNEKIHIEFYQILSEEAFDSALSKTNFSNMKLIQHLTIPIKYLPFND